MVFSAVEFLYFFLPGVLLVHLVAPQRLRNLVILAASVVFAGWGGATVLAILATSVAVDYVAGWFVATARRRGDHRRVRLGLAVSVLANLGLLGWFKYANFFVDQLQSMGVGPSIWRDVGLPLGISFFTFQSMSYTIDVARGRVNHLANPLDFALYVTLFPQLVAGPIVRYHELAGEIRTRTVTAEGFADGALRFVHGLGKKVIVADAIAPIADAGFAIGGDDRGIVVAWIAVLAYTMQIYFDFSGYSDMAIGLGLMLGFHFPENFKRPYSAVSVTDFWRRWHITLSNWFRDYVYIPLGGSQDGRFRTVLNLIIVFAVTGLWHGAAWTFVLWGGYHGLVLLVERFSGTRHVDTVSHEWFSRARTLLLVVIGWVLFRADGLDSAVGMYRAMAGLEGVGTLDPSVMGLSGRSAVVFALAMLVVLLPRNLVIGPALTMPELRFITPVRLAVMGLVLPYALLRVTGSSFSPFLYYQF